MYGGNPSEYKELKNDRKYAQSHLSKIQCDPLHITHTNTAPSLHIPAELNILFPNFESKI